MIFWNYLRARGEYSAVQVSATPFWELPPRTRRILHSETFQGRQPGNYLRARGEYGILLPSTMTTTELPPRTRRIHVTFRLLSSGFGTTSAHAENTPKLQNGVQAARNYLRARGEYNSHIQTPRLIRELPPRTRRIRGCVTPFLFPKGTTSAHAENTPDWVCL